MKNYKKKRKSFSLSNIIIGVMALIIASFAISRAFDILVNDESPLFGVNIFISSSELMSPAIDSGSLIITSKKDCENISPGEIITYRVGNSVLTQRVVERATEVPEYEGIVYYTKADSETQTNPVPVNPKQILGVYQFSVNYIGGVLLQLQKPVWFALYLVIVVFLFSINDIYRLIWAKRKRRKRKRSESVAPSGNYFEMWR
jgi:signal peptidase I